MIQVELKHLHSPDIVNLQSFQPECLDNFGFLLQIIVGRKNDINDGESFDAFVCTPKWLLDNHKQYDIIIGLHYIIIFEYSYERLYNRLYHFIEEIKVESWQELGAELGKIGKWEFDNYLD